MNTQSLNEIEVRRKHMVFKQDPSDADISITVYANTTHVESFKQVQISGIRIRNNTYEIPFKNINLTYIGQFIPFV